MGRKQTHPHVLLSIGSDERITHDVDLEGVETGTGRSLESHANGASLTLADVGEAVRSDEDTVELVIADKDVPGRLAVLCANERVSQTPRREKRKEYEPWGSAERERGESGRFPPPSCYDDR
jgi:hypothetical protein